MVEKGLSSMGCRVLKTASTPAMEASVQFQEKPEKAEKELHFFIKFYAALQKVTY